MILRLWMLFYYRHTGYSWSPSMGCIGIYPTWRWVRTGNDSDASTRSNVSEAVAAMKKRRRHRPWR